ncbi:VWA domain-containing protein [Aquihabitans daechungensis]|uniref:VWA domain-containing protein n=1 Tax=Aquihabitans daechungensis TaxID=1052257 RepID=UPI003B9FF67E
MARGLAALLPGDAPFVELPLGATEDRVVGSIDLASLLRDGTPEVRLGLLAAAHGGVLYVDEINLLADHLVDVLLDVAVSGVNRVERDGVAHEHPARFVLIGSMNPEEGELRPQLLDRFGLCVDVHASTDRSVRAAAVRRRLDADRSPDALGPEHDADAALAARLTSLGAATVPDELVDLACAVALEVGAEGLRADLVLCRAAGAHAAWRGASEADEDDLRAVAPFVLGHRRRRSPLDPPVVPPEELDRAFDDAAAQVDGPPPDPSTDPSDDGDDDGGDDEDDAPGGASPPAPPHEAAAPPELRAARARADAQAGRRGSGEAERGRFVRATEPTASQPVTAGTVAVAATAVAAATRRAADGQDGAGPIDATDLRRAVREQRTGTLVVLCVDASGSMGADRRIELAKGAVLGLLTDAYQRRDRVALVTFGGAGAQVALRPTASVEIARSRLADLPTGGVSPIAEGLDAVHQLVAGSSGDHGLDPLVVLLTDGRATGADDAVERSRASAARLASAGIATVVVDAESGATRLGLAAELAEAAGAPCLPLDGLVEGSLERTIRLQLR